MLRMAITLHTVNSGDSLLLNNKIIPTLVQHRPTANPNLDTQGNWWHLHILNFDWLEWMRYISLSLYPILKIRHLKTFEVKILKK